MSKRKSSHGYRPPPRGAPAPSSGGGGGLLWIYGTHAVLAALANPARRCHRLLLSDEAARRHGDAVAAVIAARSAAGDSRLTAPETASPHGLAQVLPDGAVHQGLAVQVAPLPDRALADVLTGGGAAAARRLVVVLDQVTDPQNVGAVLRSAAAFGAMAVIAPDRHSAPDTGALAKAASGALDHVPYVRVGNLARCLEELKGAGFWCLGLAGDAEKTLAEADPGGPLALVLGAEGSGLRRLTREGCDVLARLPTREPISTLNVSTAAAVALYALLAV